MEQNKENNEPISGAYSLQLHSDIVKSIKEERRPYGVRKRNEYDDDGNKGAVDGLCYEIYAESTDAEIDGKRVRINIPKEVHYFDPDELRKKGKRLPLVTVKSYSRSYLGRYNTINVVADDVEVRES